MIQIGPAIRQRAKALRDITLQCTRSDDVQPMSENRQRSVSVHAKQSSTQPVLAQENCWNWQNSSRNVTTTFRFVSRWFQTRQDTFYSAGDQADSNISKYVALQCSSGYERNVYLGVERTLRTTLQISSRNIWMDCERSRSQGNLDFESWIVRMVRMGTTEDW